MVSPAHLRLNASDRSYFAILKKEIHALAATAPFSARRLGEIDIVVAEIVSNLAKHAVGGELFVKLVESKGIQGIEIIAIDEGPGMSDVHRMMQDGTSTKNTLGHGLGSIKRLTDFFQVYSQKGWGTIKLCRLFAKELPQARKPPLAEIRSLVVPKPGETACGDGFSEIHTKDSIRLFLGDGLGHGIEAEKAVQTAIEAFKDCPEDSPMEILRYLHTATRKTRGLVGTVAIFNVRDRQWSICGIGNIMTRFHGAILPKTHNSYNGIIGLNIPNSMKDTLVTHEPGQIMTLTSDGIRSRWETLRHPGLLRNDYALLNAAIFKDFARHTDDMSIVSCKINV